jgi:hypothetical protein
LQSAASATGEVWRSQRNRPTEQAWGGLRPWRSRGRFFPAEMRNPAQPRRTKRFTARRSMTHATEAFCFHGRPRDGCQISRDPPPVLHHAAQQQQQASRNMIPGRAGLRPLDRAASQIHLLLVRCAPPSLAAFTHYAPPTRYDALRRCVQRRAHQSS